MDGFEDFLFYMLLMVATVPVAVIAYGLMWLGKEFFLNN